MHSHLTFSTSAGAGGLRVCARASAARTPPTMRDPAPALYGWSPNARSASFRNAALACSGERMGTEAEELSQ